MRRPSLSILRRLTRDRKGATAMEYGLIVALISIAIVAALGGIGSKIGAALIRLAEALG
ncbi:Flp family type IVb pilin [Brevundimonas sp. PAMC22021]|uniref:Flp family type IVb pilin n=1 Tax=Brevundimonas sp. PAMC22021 TaxID=2861285 RepID=UPI001C62D1F4|nr:Flp family type IVb pilin [Brevundimonas sp. PAMC22021]QYF86652.1 Flp family type IVb pilin [Brevundimonas sp. PAMC22021]